MKKPSLVSIFRVFLIFSSLWGGLAYAQTPTYTVGGTVSGLASGKSLVLRNNTSSIIVSSNGGFTFPSQSQGTSWNVSVGIQPTGQICTVGNASGNNISSNVSNVTVTCVNAYNVGGTINGLAAPGLVLRLNNSSSLMIAGSATSFKFSTSLVNGSTYSVSVAIQPSGYVCLVTNGAGSISGVNINNVSVSCVVGFTVGGTIAGLNASGLVLKLNNSASKIVQSGSTSFNFSALITVGTSYQVTVVNQPTGKYCYIANAGGIVASAAITNVAVVCVNTYSVNYQTTGLRSGRSIDLQLQLSPPTGQSNTNYPALSNSGAETVQISSNGSGSLSLKAPQGFNYSFQITSPNGQRCVVTPSAGTISASLNAVVSCSDLWFVTVPVQVPVSIPEGMGTVSISNTTSKGTETCSVPVPGGNTCVFGPYDTNESFNVQVTQQPISQICQVSVPSSGVVAGNLIVPIACEVKQFRISGFVSGNSEPLVLTNNGDDSQIIPVDGGYYEFSVQDYLSTWNVQIANSLSGQRCYVFNHTGTLTSNYSNVNVNCASSYIVGGTVTGLNSGGTLKLTKTVTHASQSIFNTEAGAELSSIGAISDSPGTQGTVGWGFSLSHNMTVSHLGAWIGGSIYGDVLVGLWNGAGNLVASVNLTESNFSALQIEGDFGYMSLANNVSLLAGEQYTIGAYYNGGIVMAYSSVISPINGLNFVSPSLVNLDVVGLAMPTETFSSSMPLGFFGPNMRVTAPEYGDEVEEITLTADGLFSFPTEVADGDSYSISISGQPTGQSCSIVNASGTVGTTNVSNVNVTCTKNSSSSSSASSITAYTVSTFAGSGSFSYADGNGTAAAFARPFGVAVDASANVYVADTWYALIRKINSTGVVSTMASSFGGGYLAGVAVDSLGNVYVADHSNHRILKITPSGVVSVLAGSPAYGFTDGLGAAAQFRWPRGVAVDSSGNVYVADGDNDRIRKITPAGVVTTLAGSGVRGATDGLANSASFTYPSGVAVDSAGNVYVADAGNNRIRKISTSGVVSTLAGSGAAGYANGVGSAASFNWPQGIAVDAIGNVYVADFWNNRIRKITSTGVVTTIAGSGAEAFADGVGSAASFYHPIGIAIDGIGNVYVGDYENNRIRKLTPEYKTYAIGDSGPAGGIVFYTTDGGKHGLEVGPVDLGPAGFATDEYCLHHVITPNNNIGAGRPNTDTIIAQCGTNNAAYLAKSYVLNGYNDWYLPSIDELRQIFNNKSLVSGLCAMNYSWDVWYWSSSDHLGADWNALPLPCVSTSQWDVNKGVGFALRPVRNF